MSQQSKSSYKARLKKHAREIAVGVAILALGAGTSVAVVSATSCSGVNECNDKISSLQSENDASQAAISKLQSQAASYDSVISQLQSQISSLQATINQNEAEQAQLQAQIDSYQAQITAQKQVLANDLRSMYVNGGMSSLEMLASSNNLSDYVDQQEYRNVIQAKIQQTLARISSLQDQVKAKKLQVDNLLQSLNAQQAELSAAESKQQQLLSYNQSQQAGFTSQMQTNNAQIAEMQQERAAALRRIEGSGGKSAVGAPIKYMNFWTGYSLCGGGYSYCSAGFDQFVSDPWGLDYAHECVHFVADWLTRHGYQVPNMAGAGNADMWPGYGAHIPASQVQVGDVAYMPIPPVGHVGVVTAINGDGTFHIEQMNWPVGGYYSEMDLYPQNVTFIRFPR